MTFLDSSHLIPLHLLTLLINIHYYKTYTHHDEFSERIYTLNCKLSYALKNFFQSSSCIQGYFHGDFSLNTLVPLHTLYIQYFLSLVLKALHRMHARVKTHFL